eukprot:322872-Pelagomonas_calceolata.AAC.1
MKTERHNIAGRMITKALIKSPLGAGLIYTDISDFKLAQHNLQTLAHASNRTTPSYVFPRSLSVRARSASSRPDPILITPHNAQTTSNN